MSWRSGEASIAAAALLFSIGNLAVKLTCMHLPVLEVSAFISSGGIILVFFIVLQSGTRILAKDSRTAWLAAARAFLGAATTIFYYTAIQLVGLRDSTALFFTSPFWTLVLESAVHGTMPGPSTALGAMTTAMGALFISKRCFCLFFRGTWLEDYGICVEPDNAPPVASSIPSVSFVTGLTDDYVIYQLLGMFLAVLAAVSNSLVFLTIRAIAGNMPPLSLALW